MIKLGSQLQEAAEQLEREKGIPKDLFIESIKDAMMAAYKRYAHIQELEDPTLYDSRLYERSGEVGIFKRMTVVKKVKDEETEINVETALETDVEAKVGDEIYIDITPTDFGRIAAQSAKQVMTQRLREAEKTLVFQEFEKHKHQVIPAIVQRVEGRNVIVSIGRLEAFMPAREQLPGEYYRVGSKVRVFVSELRDNGRVPQIIVSQGHPQMVREVFELEVPEIEDGLVEIRAISRDAGYRTKVAVHSTDPDVDPQGACIGARGSRIQAIVNELKNEKIDIIRWSDDPATFITNALAPAKIASVELTSEEPPVATVVVPDDQLSLAIGRGGQNVRLAAQLTGWRLDIKSISQLQEGGEGPVEAPEPVLAHAVAPAAEAKTDDEPLPEFATEDFLDAVPESDDAADEE